jgi:hypothetical protein
MVAVPSSLPSALSPLLLLLPPLLLLPVGGSSSHRADWLHECGWGVFTHFLPLNRDVPTTNAAAWNRIVDSFNATHLAEQLSSVGACYYFITIGQDSGWYLGPNKVYDEFAGYDPPHTSRRDLISDIHAALAPKNIKLGVYLPYEAPMEDANVSQKLSFRYLPHVSQDLLGGRFPLGRTLRNHSRGPWEPERYGLDDSHGEIFGHGRPYGFGADRLVTFQTAWNKIIAAWSELYGDKVSGWWFDGCYHSYDLHDFADDDPPNFKVRGVGRCCCCHQPDDDGPPAASLAATHRHCPRHGITHVFPRRHTSTLPTPWNHTCVSSPPHIDTAHAMESHMCFLAATHRHCPRHGITHVFTYICVCGVRACADVRRRRTCRQPRRCAGVQSRSGAVAPIALHPSRFHRRRDR